MTLGYLRQGSARWEVWRAIMGDGAQDVAVPLLSPIPFVGTAPGHDHGALFYAVDVVALTPEQLERAIAVMAERFRVPTEEVRRGVMGEHGIPVLADDVAVVTDLRGLL